MKPHKQAGRPPLPTNQKKLPHTVYLTKPHSTYLINKYGSMIEAVNSLLPKEAIK